ESFHRLCCGTSSPLTIEEMAPGLLDDIMRSLSLLVAPALAVTALALSCGAAQDRPDPPRVPAADGVPDGIEPLVRGPLHEAYAQPIDFNPEPGLPAPKPPPAPIPEAPPEMQPEGDNVQWLPGYWAWDSEANEFRWVSGVYRDAPPGRTWLPGRWTFT